MTSYIQEEHVVVMAEIREFSNGSIHLPGSENMTKYMIECDGHDTRYIPAYSLKVFANGWSENSKGYVCAIFGFPENVFYSGYCIISVIDICDNQRFSQTFTISDGHEIQEDLCIQYIPREKLLSDPDEYLPNDALKLLIDMNITERSYLYMCILPKAKLRLTHDGPSHAIKFDLNSTIARRLAEESDYFRRILCTSMLEGSTKTMSIVEGEITSFDYIGLIFNEEKILDFESVKGVFDLYIVADKYDIPTVDEFCTGFLKLCLSDHTVDECLEIANGYETEYLKDLIRNLINRVTNTDMDKELVRENHGLRLKQSVRRRICFYKNMGFSLNFEIIPDSQIPKEDYTFDFYK